jgi:hypothetical protein
MFVDLFSNWVIPASSSQEEVPQLIAKSLLIRSIAVVTSLLVLPLASSAALASEAPPARCANEAVSGFRSYLPDCRAYEIVTAPYKEAIPINLEAIAPEVGKDAPRLLARSFGSFSNIENQTGLGALYEVEREASGRWKSTPLDAPFSEFSAFEVSAPSTDLSHSFWVSVCQLPMRCGRPTSLENRELEDFYLRGPGGVVTWIGPGGPPTASERVATFAGASSDSDLSHVILQASAPLAASSEVRLWPGDKTEGESQSSLYEYAGTGNTEPQLIGVSDEGPIANMAESHLISRCGTEFGGASGDAYNAISHDGSKVFFTALGFSARRACRGLSPAVEPAANEVYARIDNGQRDAHTVAISEPPLSVPGRECSGACIQDENEEEGHQRSAGVFEGASQDGSKVFFRTTQPLVNSDENAEGTGADLYEAEIGEVDEAGIRRDGVTRLIQISHSPSAGEAAEVQGVARVSEDGSHVYFVAQGVLTSEPNAYGDRAQKEAYNLYLFVRECAGGGASCPEPEQRLSFIGRLSEQDKADWGGNDSRPVQATPDGQFLVFRSGADLTPDEEGREEAGQVFEYNAEAKTLVRVSRGANGYNEDGNSSQYDASIPVQSYREHDYPTQPLESLAMSADGGYVFFTSEDALVPQALTGSLNVYEYHNERVALISDGHDLSIVEESPGVILLGTDESGRDVFFKTTDQLLPQDIDTQQDIYDARIGGGIAPEIALAPCSGDSCQGALAGALQSPVSSTLSSSGESALSTSSDASRKGRPTSIGPKKTGAKKGRKGARKRKRKRHGARRARKGRR